MNKNKFIAIDIGMMLFLTAAIEVGLYFFAKGIDITTQGYTLTFVVNIYVTMSLLVLYRWNKIGILFNFIMTVIYLLVSLVIAPIEIYTFDDIWQKCLIYLGGVLSFSLTLLLFKKVEKEKIKNKKILTALYVITGYLCIVIGRALVAVVIGLFTKDNVEVLGIFGAHLSMEMLNIVFGILIMFVLRGQKDIFIDMNSYLLAIQKQKEILNSGRSQEYANHK